MFAAYGSDAGNGLIQSTDGLNTFNIVLNVGADRVEDIEFVPSDASLVFCSTNGLKIYKSTDGGNSFSLLANLREYIDSH